MQQLSFFTLLSAALITGCVQQPAPAVSHPAAVIAKLALNEHVLNCVVESGHHVYEQTTICPIGGESFTSLHLGTHSTYGRHLDWEPVSYMRFPIPIPVCPSNGFVVSESAYSSEQLAKRHKLLQSTQYQALYQQKHATFFLYAKTLELTAEKSPDQWWLYLNASWEADHCGDKDRYQQYAQLVIAAAQAKLAELTPDMEEYWVLRIITANMYRRIGDFDQAAAHYANIGQPALANPQSNAFFLLAKKQLAAAIASKNTNRVAIENDKDVAQSNELFD